MTAYRWILPATVVWIHTQQIKEHGGLPGLRSQDALLTALARPQNKLQYNVPPPDIAALAAAYAFGLSRSHPFHDGNKRVAFAVMELFLDLYAYHFVMDDLECIALVMQLAAGEVTEDALADVIRAHLVMA